MHLYRFQALGMLVILALMVRGCNDEESENSTWDHTGSTWRITAEVAQDYEPRPHLVSLNEGPSRSSYVGTFRVLGSPRTTEEELPSPVSYTSYALEQIALSGTHTYVHPADHLTIGQDEYECTGATGSFPIGSELQITGTYYIFDEPRDYGEAGVSRFVMRVTIGFRDPMAMSLPTHSFSYTCTDEEGRLQTHSRGVGPIPRVLYLGEAATRTLVTTSVIPIRESVTIIRLHNIRLECLSNCAPPAEPPTEEPEEDECNPEEPLDRCREARGRILEFCRTLQDWMIVEDTSDSEPQVTCADVDCTGAQAANAGTAPWVGVTEHYSSACSELAGDVACSVECYGWGKAQAP